MHCILIISLISLAVKAAVVEVPIGTFQAPLPTAQRSACPLLNTLSNHGYLNRDGGNNTRKAIKTTFMEVLNIGEDISNFFLDASFRLGMGEGQNQTLRLGALNEHGLIEHDVSLVRDDIYFHNNVLAINQTLVQRLLSYSANGKTLSLSELGRFRKDRYLESKATNPTLTFGASEEFIAFGEGALLLAILSREYGMPLDQVQAFLGEERFTGDFKKRKDTLHLPDLLWIMGRLKVSAGIFAS